VTIGRRTIVSALVAIVGAAAIVVVVLLTTQPGSPTPHLPASGLVARGSVTPTTAHFGDTIVVRVDVLYDPKPVVAPKLTMSRDLSAYVAAGAPVAVRSSVGRARAVVYTVRLTCLDHGCLPPDPATGNATSLFTLPSFAIAYTTPGRGAQTEQIQLPQVQVTSRLAPLDAARLAGPPHPPLRAATSPLPVHYPVSPLLLEVLFVAAAILLLALAGILFQRFGPSFRRTRPLPSPLEQALALVELSRSRGLIPEQRKALELLAHELGRNGADELAVWARILAWSEPAPEADATVTLTGKVRESVLAGTNGRPR
jgi:hypothetical protein